MTEGSRNVRYKSVISFGPWFRHDTGANPGDWECTCSANVSRNTCTIFYFSHKHWGMREIYVWSLVPAAYNFPSQQFYYQLTELRSDWLGRAGRVGREALEVWRKGRREEAPKGRRKTSKLLGWQQWPGLRKREGEWVTKVSRLSTHQYLYSFILLLC